MSNFPNMLDAMSEWMAPLVYRLVTTTIVNFQSVESINTIKFQGLSYPSTPQQIMLKPEGHRQWRWRNLITAYNLSVNDVMISSSGIKYKIFSKMDYSQAGYYQYELVEGWID